MGLPVTGNIAGNAGRRCSLGNRLGAGGSRRAFKLARRERSAPSPLAGEGGGEGWPQARLPVRTPLPNPKSELRSSRPRKGRGNGERAANWRDGDARRSLGGAGANHFRFTEIVSSRKFLQIKNISVVVRPKSVRIYRHPVPLRRASAVVTDVGRVAVDAGSRLTTAWIERTAKPCGPGARCRRQAVGEARAEPAATESTKNSSPGRARHKP